MLLDHYEYGRERGWSEHKRVETWGTEGMARHRENKTRTIKEQSENVCSFSFSGFVSSVRPGRPTVLGSTVHNLLKEMAACFSLHPPEVTLYLSPHLQQYPEYPEEP